MLQSFIKSIHFLELPFMIFKHLVQIDKDDTLYFLFPMINKRDILQLIRKTK